MNIRMVFDREFARAVRVRGLDAVRPRGRPGIKVVALVTPRPSVVASTQNTAVGDVSGTTWVFGGIHNRVQCLRPRPTLWKQTLYARVYQIDVTRQPIYRDAPPRLSLLCGRTTWFPRRRRQRLVGARVERNAPANHPSTSRPFIGPSSRDDRRETEGRARSAVA